MASIAIVGSGEGVEASPAAIRESLDEAVKDNDIAVGWYGKPSPSLKAVYDYFMKGKRAFTLVHNGKVPAVFESAEHVTLMESDNITKGLANLTSHKDDGGKGLVLTADDDDILKFLDSSASDDLPLFDLALGLTPIEFEEGEEEDEYSVEEDAPTPIVVTPDEGDDEDDIDVSGFTEEQLRGLSFRILKRVAGVHVDDKEHAIRVILNEPIEVDVEEAPKVEAPEVTYTEEVAEAVDRADRLDVFAALNAVLDTLLSDEWTPSREVSLTITKVEEALMWLDKAVDIDIQESIKEVRG